jgi:hypothetical protein
MLNVFLCDLMVSDPQGIITRGFEVQTDRQIKIDEGESINRPALPAMLREIIAHNRTGGWRTLKTAAIDRPAQGMPDQTG